MSHFAVFFILFFAVLVLCSGMCDGMCVPVSLCAVMLHRGRGVWCGAADAPVPCAMAAAGLEERRMFVVKKRSAVVDMA